MNFQVVPVSPPARVLVTNPLTATAQMTITKILSGLVFGKTQPIDLILLVYSNELPKANIFKRELKTCGFTCLNSIQISSSLPNYMDADVFLFITTLNNPNTLDYDNISNEEFDALYLIIKVANNLKRSKPLKETEKNKTGSPKKVRYPIIMADGLITMDILCSVSHNLPQCNFFCPTSLPSIANHILAENLKARCKDINYILVWAADDKVFHVEVLKPFIVHDVAHTGDSEFGWDAISKDVLESLEYDHTIFNESWMKKEYIDKIEAVAVKNPYGDLYKTIEFCRTLNLIWNARINQEGVQKRCSVGTISDGSLGTMKGCAYILPLKLNDGDWVVDRSFEETYFLRQQIKKINAVVKPRHEKLVKYCKKFVQDNIINQVFITSEHDSISVSTILGESPHTSTICSYHG